MAEWTCVGGGASLVLGGAVLDSTAFKWIGRVDLPWRAGKSCIGWGSFRFNSLHMDWENGLVLEGEQVLSWEGAVLDLTAFMWVGRGDLFWREGTSCLGWGSLRCSNLQRDWESGLVLEREQVLSWVG